MNSMLKEYSYIWNERNSDNKNEVDAEGKDYEWVELPDWENPNKKIRFKKYKDLDGIVKSNTY